MEVTDSVNIMNPKNIKQCSKLTPDFQSYNILLDFVSKWVLLKQSCAIEMQVTSVL